MNKLQLLTPDLEDKFLKTLHDRYVENFGHLTHRLDEYEFFTVGAYEEIRLPISETETWTPTVDLAKSLEKKGLLRFSENRTSFFLTEQGYKRAEIGRTEKILTWLNMNQGVISAATFIVSIVSFFKH